MMGLQMSSRKDNQLAAARMGYKWVGADLCCGLGGLSLAARNAGVAISVGVDVNAHALKTFKKNFPEACAIDGSVRSQKALGRCKRALFEETSQRRTIIVSGPPCQGFSAAGSRDPKDRRNYIITAVGRAIAHLQPDCALVENVSMILAEKHDTRLSEFQSTLTRANYYVLQVLLNAADFGVPQNRRRAFFLVSRFPLCEKQVVEELGAYRAPARTVSETLRGLAEPPVRPLRYDDEEHCGIPPNHFAMIHSEAVKEKISKIPPGSGPMSYRRLHPTRSSNTLFSGHRAPPAHFHEPRSITVREAARLQGFPDTFRIYGSFANQMEQVTNAVPPPLAEAVIRVLIKLETKF
jgi:DNA (cytosine-5)-methyltransferase 1